MSSRPQESKKRTLSFAPTIGIFASIVTLGFSSLIAGHTPFSPAFCHHYPTLSGLIYTVFLVSLWSYEMRHSPYSVRPELEEDNHHPFWLYLGSLFVLLGFFVPNLWIQLGDLSLRGASLDMSLYQTLSQSLTCLTLGFIVVKLRGWAHECKDISRVDRVSPIAPIALDHPLRPQSKEVGGIMKSSEEVAVEIAEAVAQASTEERDEVVEDLHISARVHPFDESIILTSTHLHLTHDRLSQDDISYSSSEVNHSQRFTHEYQERRRAKLARDTRAAQTHLSTSAQLRGLSEDNIQRGFSEVITQHTRRSTGDYDTRFDAHPPEFTHVEEALKPLSLNESTYFLDEGSAGLISTPEIDETDFLSPAHPFNTDVALSRQLEDQMQAHQDVEAGLISLNFTDDAFNFSLSTNTPQLVSQSSLSNVKSESPSNEELERVQSLNNSDTLITPPQSEMIRALKSMSDVEPEIWDEVNEII